MAEACRSCGAAIDWCVKFPEEMNAQGMPKTMPVNHDSWDDPKGNIVAWRGEPLLLGDGTPGPAVTYFRYLKKGEEPKDGEHRGISHFATCRDAGQWRRNQKPRTTP